MRSGADPDSAGTRERRAAGAARATLRFDLLSLGAYTAVSVAMLAPVLRHAATAYTGSISDAAQSIWFLSWTEHALEQHQPLLLTHAVNAPYGANLMWNTPMTLLGVIAAPITRAWGPVVAYNLLLTAAPALSGWTAGRLFARLCDDRLASWVGGLMFLLSPYMLAQSLGHLDLVLLVYPPVALALLHEMVVTRRRPWWAAGGALGLATAAQILVMEEVVLIAAVAGAVSVLTLAMRFRERIASHWRHAVAALATAAATAALLAGGPLLLQVAGPHVPRGLSEVVNATGGDALAFGVPTTNQALSGALARGVTSQFTAQATGQDSYIGLPLLVLLALLLWRHRRDVRFAVAGVTGLAATVLSLGPSLTVLGRDTGVPLPWALAEHLPLIGNAVPVRFAAVTDLCIAAIVAWGLAEARREGGRHRTAVGLLAALSLATWFPALPRPALTVPTPQALPAAVARAIPPHGTVLFAPLPSLSTVRPLWYQMNASFAFDLLGGYVYGERPAIPLAAVLDAPSTTGIDAATARIIRGAEGPKVLAGFRALGVRTVVVPPGPAASAYRALFTAVCGDAPHTTAGFAWWTLGPAG